MTGIRHFTASAIVFNDDAEVLLVHHNKLDMWLYPGGHVDANEDPAQAAIREVAEETGVQATPLGGPRFTHPAVRSHPVPWVVIEMPVNDSKVGPHHHIDMVYVCHAPHPDTTAQLNEVSACGWFPTQRIPDLDTPDELPELVAAAADWARRYFTTPVT